jgi:branched-chain amino acid transport system permease protein
MLAGVILGLPALRLRGDYLAIITLGFGEIVRIVAVNTEAIGGAAGITDIPKVQPLCLALNSRLWIHVRITGSH